MKLPLFLSEQGDLHMFESLADLELSVESPDIGDYRIFDADGSEFGFEGELIQPPENLKKGWFASVQVLPVRVDCAHPFSTAPQQFAEILRENLSALGLPGDTLSKMSMQDMVEFWGSHYFTRRQ